MVFQSACQADVNVSENLAPPMSQLTSASHTWPGVST